MSAAAAVDVSAQTSNWSASINNYKSGDTVTPGRVIGLDTKFSIPDSANAGDTITITLPDYIIAAGGTNVPVNDSSGNLIGTLTTPAGSVSSQTLTLTLSDYVDSHTSVSAEASFNVKGIQPYWANNTDEIVGFSVGGQDVSTGTTLHMRYPIASDWGSFTQNDVAGPGWSMSAGVITTNGVNGDTTPQSGPFTVTEKAMPNTHWNCDYMKNTLKGIPSLGYKLDSSGIATPDNNSIIKGTITSCSNDTLVFNVPKITDPSTGKEYESVGWQTWLLMDNTSYAKKQTTFDPGSMTVVSTDPTTGASQTTTTSKPETAPYIYNSGAGAGTILPAVTLKAYIDDATVSDPTGKTSNNQDSDADKVPGISVKDGAQTISLKITNNGYLDLTNLVVKDSAGKTAGTIDSLAIGETKTISVTDDVTGSETGTAYTNTYIVTADSSNGSATSSDPVNATVFTAPATSDKLQFESYD